MGGHLINLIRMFNKSLLFIYTFIALINMYVYVYCVCIDCRYTYTIVDTSIILFHFFLENISTYLNIFREILKISQEGTIIRK